MHNVLLLVVSLFAATLCFGADPYPSQPVRIIVPFGPGGTSDIVARIVAQQLSEQLGKSFVVDNRAGAGGRIGTEAVAKSAPNGYTLLLGDQGFTTLPGLYKSLPYDPSKDFTPVTNIMRVANVLVVVPTLKANTIREFIALAQASPGKLNYGAAGVGSGNQLAAELFKTAAKVDIAHVTYNGGGGELINAMLSGEIQMIIISIPTVLQFVKNNQLRALAVTSDGKRSSAMPDVPSFSEAGVNGMTIYAWSAFIGPAGIPMDIVTKLQAEVVKAIAAPAVRDRLIGLGGELLASTPDDFSAYIRSEIPRWAQVIKAAGIALD